MELLKRFVTPVNVLVAFGLLLLTTGAMVYLFGPDVVHSWIGAVWTWFTRSA